jgi:hypothetical protein
MTDYYSAEQPAPAGYPTVKGPGNAVNSPVRRSISTFTCNAAGVGAAAIGALLHLAKVPKGARGVRHKITVGATLGASTLSIGIAGTAAKYGAAATYTTANTPVTVAKAANLAAELAADEDQILTVGAAALPNDGTVIVVETEYTLV